MLFICEHFSRHVMLCSANVPKGGESDQMSSIHNKCSTYQLINLAKVLNSQLIVKYTLVEILFMNVWSKSMLFKLLDLAVSICQYMFHLWTLTSAFVRHELMGGECAAASTSMTSGAKRFSGKLFHKVNTIGVKLWSRRYFFSFFFFPSHSQVLKDSYLDHLNSTRKLQVNFPCARSWQTF